jgi:hypothetical protein
MFKFPDASESMTDELLMLETCHQDSLVWDGDTLSS